MIIKTLRLWHVPLTSHVAYYMAEGKACDTVETVVIAVETDTGVTGWGEVCPIPHYLPAYARGVAPALQELAPAILGQNPIGAEAMMAAADAYLPGHRYAKSALDIALWDITGKVAGLPLHALLGGQRQADLPLYHSITCIEPDEMARIARKAQAQGISQFQAKLGASGDWSNGCGAPGQASARPSAPAHWSMGIGTAARPRWMRFAWDAGAAHLDVMLEAALRHAGRVRPGAIRPPACP